MRGGCQEESAIKGVKNPIRPETGRSTEEESGGMTAREVEGTRGEYVVLVYVYVAISSTNLSVNGEQGSRAVV
ncbi:hypothetical protein NDU88_003556 [Pleurodeles waltl]|uniref:Uncharacterized protein n=1 Tax=Pleurodeles waltl TaxID=8319 RepID=A0AAV7WT49_PLEWA|nr:hypothetical protein NDU88_003556 [Pleurodeles waltl]